MNRDSQTILQGLTSPQLLPPESEPDPAFRGVRQELWHSPLVASSNQPQTTTHHTMRLTPQQCQRIVATVREQLGPRARPSLFGSRLNDQARGGDIDLVIECPSHVPVLQKAKLKLALEGETGLPVDLVIVQDGQAPTPFQSIAKAQAQPLTPAA